MPGLMSSFNGTHPTYGTGRRSTHRSANWDESTLGAPGEDPEVAAADDPDRVLALVPGKKSMQSGKNQITKTTSVTEVSEYQHQYSGSDSSSSRH